GRRVHGQPSPGRQCAVPHRHGDQDALRGPRVAPGAPQEPARGACRPRGRMLSGRAATRAGPAHKWSSLCASRMAHALQLPPEPTSCALSLPTVTALSSPRNERECTMEGRGAAFTRGGPAMIDWWSETEHAVVECLASAGPMSPQDLARRLGLSEGETIGFLCM